ncbi:MAG: YlxR family protein, partial [Clostridia bacterium]|nr:YlxR family protein [Clostridia bacterium]
MKTRKIPMRMCVGCREMKEKKSLLRVVKHAEKGIVFDPGGKVPGRGAYICRSEECLEKARKQKQLERSLETSISDEVYERLKE